MKWLFCIATFVGVLMAGAEGLASGKGAGPNPQNFVRVQGRQFVVGADGTPVVLRGINFRNFFWIESSWELVSSGHHSPVDFERVADMGMNVIRFP